MAITTQVVSVGTAAATIALPTIDSQRLWVENLEPADEMGELSRQGNVYAVSQDVTLSNGGTAIFSFTTGETGAQFEFWNFYAEESSVLAELIEGATITTTGTALPAYNLNRNESDSYGAVLESASALTGGTVVLSEWVGASNQASGGVQSNKIVTLEPNTEYGFRFTDVGGQGTDIHIMIGWAELYNGYNAVWLNGDSGQTVKLRGGERLQIDLQQGEGMTGVALRDGVRVAVMRQD